MNVHRILPAEITFGKTEVMDRVQQIRLAHTVAAANANDPLRKLKVLLKIILKLEERYGMKVKTQDLELSLRYSFHRLQQSFKDRIN
jgi:hypothetical protein